MCGVETPAGLPGRDLFAPGAEQAPSSVFMTTLRASSETRLGLVRDGYKYLVTLDQRGQIQSEALTRLGDESTKRPTSDPGLARLRSALRATIQRLGPSQPGRRQDIGDEERRTLDALGYGGATDG